MCYVNMQSKLKSYKDSIKHTKHIYIQRSIGYVNTILNCIIICFYWIKKGYLLNHSKTNQLLLLLMMNPLFLRFYFSLAGAKDYLQ